MPTVTIRIDGLKEALEALNIPESEMVAKAGKAAALATIAAAKPYPGQSRKKQPFKSTQQRRGFFAKLKSGAITVPYRRTYALQDAWDYTMTPEGADVINAHPHADGVIGGPGRPRKWPYHIGNWPTETQLAERAKDAAGDAAEKAIVSLVTGLT
jgi:hypothetical protein